MSLEAQMTRPVTIIQAGTSPSVDEYGKPTPGTPTTTDLLGFFDQTASTEVVIGQTTFQVDGLLILPALTLLTGADKVIVDGITYEVVGEPARPWKPSVGEHHVEARLQVSR